MKVLFQFNFKTGQGTSTNLAALSYSRERFFLFSGLFYLNDLTIIPPTQRCFHSQNPPACPWKGPPPPHQPPPLTLQTTTPPRVDGGKTKSGSTDFIWYHIVTLQTPSPARMHGGRTNSLQTYSHSGPHGKRSWTKQSFHKPTFIFSWKNTLRTMVSYQGLFRLI